MTTLFSRLLRHSVLLLCFNVNVGLTNITFYSIIQSRKFLLLHGKIRAKADSLHGIIHLDWITTNFCYLTLMACLIALLTQ